MFFVSKVDFKSAFLQTGPAARDVYVRPPRSEPDRYTIWRLTAADYGLVNAYAKCQCQSDQLLLSCGLKQLLIVPQLFYCTENGRLKLLVIKLVDDLLIGGSSTLRASLIEKLSAKFEVGTISHTP